MTSPRTRARRSQPPRPSRRCSASAASIRHAACTQTHPQFLTFPPSFSLCVLHATQVNLLQLSGLQREEFVKGLAAQPELLAEVAKLQAKAPVKAERGEGS